MVVGAAESIARTQTGVGVIDLVLTGCQLSPLSALLNRPSGRTPPPGGGEGDGGQIASAAAKRVVGVRGSMAKIRTLEKVNPAVPQAFQRSPPSILLKTLPEEPRDEPTAPAYMVAGV